MGILKTVFNIVRVNRKNWKAIILCMMAATVFWFLNALNKKYTTNINFPISFEYDAKFFVPVEPLPEHIQINVSGLGWDLLRRSTGFNVPPLIIPLERPADVKKIVGETLPVLFSDQMQTLQINYVLVDTLNIHFERKISRWLTVTIDSSALKVDTRYGIVAPISVEPDSVMLEGPIGTVSKLTEPYPLDFNVGTLDESIDQMVDVRVPNNGLVSKRPDRVRLRILVEPFVERGDSIKLEVLNAPTQAQLRLGRSKIWTVVRMRESEFNSFAWDSLRATVNLKGIARGKQAVLPTLENVPEGVTILSVDSLHITY